MLYVLLPPEIDTLHTDFQLIPWFSFWQHIDQIMSSYGKQIMQAVTLILEAEHSIEIKEQVSLLNSGQI